MPTLLHLLLEHLPAELAATCLPPHHRLHLHRTCQRLHADLHLLCLTLSLRILRKLPHLHLRLARLSHTFRLAHLDFSHIALDYDVLRDFATSTTINWRHVHTVMLGNKHNLKAAALDVAEWLRRCHSLARTDALECTDLHADVCAAASRCNHLYLRSIPGIHVVATQVGHFLRDCPNITSLDLEHNWINVHGDAVLSTGLATHSRLTHLNLANNFISLPGLTTAMTACRASSATLVRLDVGHNFFDREMCVCLGQLLSHCIHLQELGLEYAQLRASKIAALAQAMETPLPSLTHLRITGNRIPAQPEGAASLRQLMAKFPSVVHLGASQCNFRSEVMFAMRDAAWLPQMRHLEIFDHELGLCGGDALVSLASCFAALEHFDLSMHPRDNTGLHGLARVLAVCVKLRHFHLRPSVPVHPLAFVSQTGGLCAVLRALENCASLTHLDLGGFTLDEESAAALAEGLREARWLRVLRLSRASLGGASLHAVVQVAGQCRDLDALFLSYNRFDGVGLAAALGQWSAPSRLRELDITGCVLGVQGVRALGHVQFLLPLLERLHMQNCDLGDDGAEALARLVMPWRELRCVNAASNEIGDRGGRALGVAYAESAWALDVSDNAFGDEVEAFLRAMECVV